MTAVLSPVLFLDRPAEVGDRVLCPANEHRYATPGRVFGTDPLTGVLRVQADSGELLYVLAENLRVFAPRAGDGASDA